MRFANAVKGAAVLTIGLIVGGCAVRVRPAAVIVDPIPMPSVVVERPLIDVHVSRPVVVSRPIVVEKKTVVVNPRPVVVEKKTTVVVDKNKHDNGNHYGHDKDKFTNPANRGDNKKDDKKGVAKND
jgi:hypothetical protein